MFGGRVFKFWLRKPKCYTCDNALPEHPGILRLETADGLEEVEICDFCSEFFDKSAHILQNKKSEDEL